MSPLGPGPQPTCEKNKPKTTVCHATYYVAVSETQLGLFLDVQTSHLRLAPGTWHTRGHMDGGIHSIQWYRRLWVKAYGTVPI